MTMPEKLSPIYNPSIFEQTDLVAAKEIVLTPENGIPTEVRFATETPWLLNLISTCIAPKGVVVDFGCGVGRLSSPLVQQGHAVVGVDSSVAMRQHAIQHVANNRFTAIAPEMFDRLIQAGLKADAVVATWVLQHCFDLDEEVSRIFSALRRGGVLALADMNHRAVPTSQHGWVNDGKSVFDTLSRFLRIVKKLPYDAPNAPPNLRANAYVAFFTKD